MKTLKLSDISKKYNDITVLANANAEFTSSKITCIRGQSGAGKTTLLNIIMGVVKADKGMVEFVNDNGQSVKPVLSAVFQDCRLIEHLSPVINVKMVLKKNKKNSAKDVAFAVKSELLKLLDKLFPYILHHSSFFPLKIKTITHRRYFLMLLPSGPDMVRSRLL